MVKIIPSILTNSSADAVNFIGEAQAVAKRIQLDIIDGVFVNNKTLEPIFYKDLDLSFEVDYHLMVKEPVNWVEKCVEGQGDRIIGQIEQMGDQMEFIKKVQSVGLSVGLALDIDTPVSSLSKEILESVDVILLMSVKAGHGGQEFNLAVWDKIKELVEMRNSMSHKFKICIDGGVTVELAHDMHKAGVDEIVVGNRIFDGQLAENIKLFAEY